LISVQNLVNHPASPSSEEEEGLYDGLDVANDVYVYSNELDIRSSTTVNQLIQPVAGPSKKSGLQMKKQVL